MFPIINNALIWKKVYEQQNENYTPRQINDSVQYEIANKLEDLAEDIENTGKRLCTFLVIETIAFGMIPLALFLTLFFDWNIMGIIFLAGGLTLLLGLIGTLFL